MGKYQKYERQSYKRSNDIHPIWRGIGLLLAVLIPVLAVIGALVIIEEGQKQKWPLPSDLMGHPTLPAIIYQVPYLNDVARSISNVNNLYAIITFSVILMIAFFAVISVIYAFIYRFAGPPRYTRLDAPELSGGKRYKR